MNKTITARPAGVRAYAAGIVRLKFFLQAEDLKALGVEAKEGGLVTAVLQSFEWDAWREDATTFPKVFGTVQFTADGVEHKHMDADADHEARDWYELTGFCPAGESTGRGLYPDFATLVAQSSGKKQESVKGF